MKRAISGKWQVAGLVMLCCGVLVWSVDSMTLPKKPVSGVERVVIKRVRVPEVGVDVVYRATRVAGSTLHASGRGLPFVTYNDAADLTDDGAGPAAELLRSGGLTPRSGDAVDMNRDRAMDVVAGFGGPGGGMVTVRRGRGDGTFEAPMSYPVGIDPEYLVTGDFNNDRKADVVVAQRGVKALVMLAGKGDGTLEEGRRIGLDGNPTALLAEDFGRRDRKPELVVAVTNEEGSRLLIYQYRKGTMEAAPRVMALPGEVLGMASGQLTNDWNRDLAVATTDRLLILAGTGPTKARRASGIREPAEEKGEPPDTEQVKRVDGREDRGRTRRTDVGTPQWQRRFKRVEFDLHREIALEYRATSVAVGDFNGDRWQDVALLDASGEKVVLYRSNRGERFEAVPHEIGMRPVRMTASNVCPDGRMDLVLVDEANNRLGVMLGRKDGRLEAPVIIGVDSRPSIAIPARYINKATDGLAILKKEKGTTVVALPLAAGDIDVTTLTDEFDQDTDVSLREAIFAANLVQGPNTINFTTGPGTIGIDGPSFGPLPALSDTTGGTTIEGADIEIHGDVPGCTSCYGLKITSDNNTVNGLSFFYFESDGVNIDPAHGNVFNDVFAGGGNDDGFDIDGDDNKFNSCSAGDNDSDGFDVNAGTGNEFFDCTSTENGSLMGANGDNGYEINDDDNSIDASAGAGNNEDGVFINGNNNTVTNSEFFGNDANGGGDGEGVHINDADGNTIEGNVKIDGNGGEAGVNIILGTGNEILDNDSISNNDDDGVDIEDGAGNTVEGNTIELNTNNIGGGGGVLVDFSDENVIKDNVIQNNTDQGVWISGNDNLVDPNTISGNSGNGVYVFTGTGNKISENGIFANDLLGIDLEPGANNNQAAPVLTSACPTRVEGTLTSTPGGTFRFEFFDNILCDPSGFGEGAVFVGAGTITDNGAGDLNPAAGIIGFSITVATIQGNVTSTATRTATDDTSEFSNCLGLTPDMTPPVLGPCPANIGPVVCNLLNGKVVTYTNPTATDNCDPNPVVTCAPASGSVFPVGTTTVSCEAEDASGNTSAPCTFTVTVVEEQFILADDGNGNCLTLKTCGGVGTYCWKTPGGSFTGPVKATINGTVINIASGPGDVHILQGGANLVTRRGNARIVTGGGTFVIVDTNIDNSVCTCP